jgi:hypothetical protein
MNGDKASVYVETTIVSYLAARPSRDALLGAHQAITHDWWALRANDALREQQWQVYGEDTQAGFDALQRSQARRVNA